jgi:hypothetical protein
LDIIVKNKEGRNPMKRNIGRVDRIIRFIAGLIIIVAGIYFKSWWGLIGLAPIFTAAIGWTPFYVPFKISTRKGE